MASRFEPNARGLRELLLDSSLFSELEKPAKAIAERAKANAKPHYRTGDYERSIHTERSRGSDRVRVRAISRDDAALMLESRYQIFGRAAG